jgi:hypothetical protein
MPSWSDVMSRVANGSSLDSAVAAVTGRSTYQPPPAIVRSESRPTSLGHSSTDHYSDGSSRSFRSESGVTETGAPATRVTFETKDATGRVTNSHGWRTSDLKGGGSVTEHFGRP